jgi:hypothetical protein
MLLSAYGLPVPNWEPVHVRIKGGPAVPSMYSPGMIVHRIEESDEEIRIIYPSYGMFSKYLNNVSVEGLEGIRNTLIENNIGIVHLEIGVDKNGYVFTFDAERVAQAGDPDLPRVQSENFSVIDDLIEKAKKK